MSNGRNTSFGMAFLRRLACPMKATADARQDAAEQIVSEDEVLKNGIIKLQEFVEIGAEIDAKA